MSEHVEVLRGLRNRAEMDVRYAQGAAESARPIARADALDAAIAALSAAMQKAGDNMGAGTGHVQGSDADECPKCGDQLDYDKFSDAVCIGTFYFDVHITACPGCGHVHDDRTWVE